MRFTVLSNPLPKSGLPLLLERVFLCSFGLSSEAPFIRQAKRVAGYTKHVEGLPRPNDMWAAVMLAL
jgi:hypothetical protein